MEYINTLISDACKTTEFKALYVLFERAVEHAKFQAGKIAFLQGRVAKLEEQVKRQRAMIDNLEKTLHG